MNVRTTLLIVIAAAIVGGLAWWQYRAAPSTGRPNPFEVEGGRALLSPETYSVDAVSKIVLSRPNLAEAAVFERVAVDEWRQTSPVEWPLTSWQIRNLLTHAAELQVREEIPVAELSGELAPSALGLDPAAATLAITQEDESETTLHLGRISLGDRAYVRLAADGPVMIVNTALHDFVLKAEPKQWRERTMLEHPATDASRVTLQYRTDDGAEHEVRLRKVQGRWEMTAPYSVRTHAPAVNSLLTGLSSVSIRSFSEDNPGDLAPWGLHRPVVTVHLETDLPAVEEGGAAEVRRETVLIGGATSLAGTERTRYASVQERGVIFTVPDTVLTTLRPEPISLVSRQAVDSTADNVRAVTVSPHEDRAFALERLVEGWKLTAADAEATDFTTADSEAVERLLSWVTTDAEEVRAGGVPEGTSPLGTVTLRDFNDAGLGSVSLSLLETTVTPEAAEGEEPAEPTTAWSLMIDDGTGVVRLRTLEDAATVTLTMSAFAASGEAPQPAEDSEGGAEGGEDDPSK